jgi:transglutaminase-like putative cysteine protease
LHHAETILEIGAGDCDDKAILLAALLLSIGHTPQFIAVAFQLDNYSHVWVRDYVRGKWLDLEGTEPIECGNRIPKAGAVSHLTLTL